MANKINRSLADALWKIYRRPDPVQPWIKGSDLFWNDPAFSERVLREHLDNTHGAASRESSERMAQIDWMLLAVYLAVIVAMAGWLARRQRTTEAFFLGSRSVPWWAIAFSFFEKKRFIFGKNGFLAA